MTRIDLIIGMFQFYLVIAAMLLVIVGVYQILKAAPKFGIPSSVAFASIAAVIVGIHWLDGLTRDGAVACGVTLLVVELFRLTMQHYETRKA